jgi:protein-disulfide isomerase
MKYFLTIICAALVMFSGLVAEGLAQDKELFSTEQKAALENMIRDYLISNPNVTQEIIQAWQADQRRNQVVQQEEQIKKMRTAVIANKAEVFRPKLGFSTGNLKGDVTIVEFFDYNCGFCKRSLPHVLTLLKTDKKLRLVAKEFPILGPSSIYASRAAIASRKQDKYWEFHVALMSTRGLSEAQVLRVAKKIGLDVVRLKKDMEAPEVAQEIDANIQLAGKLGVNGTPSFVIADRPVPGAVGIEVLRAHIAEVRAKGGCKIC